MIQINEYFGMSGREVASADNWHVTFELLVCLYVKAWKRHQWRAHYTSLVIFAQHYRYNTPSNEQDHTNTLV